MTCHSICTVTVYSVLYIFPFWLRRCPNPFGVCCPTKSSVTSALLSFKSASRQSWPCDPTPFLTPPPLSSGAITSPSAPLLPPHLHLHRHRIVLHPYPNTIRPSTSTEPPALPYPCCHLCPVHSHALSARSLSTHLGRFHAHSLLSTPVKPTTHRNVKFSPSIGLASTPNLAALPCPATLLPLLLAPPTPCSLLPCPSPSARRPARANHPS